MKRRSFLRALIAAPVAAKAVATEALAKAGVTTGLGVGVDGMPNVYGSGGPVGRGESAKQPSIAEQLAHIAKERMLAKRRLMKPSQQRQIRRNVSRLDPDLAAYRSFSASALMHLQGERNIQRAMSDGTAWLDDWEEAVRMGTER